MSEDVYATPDLTKKVRYGPRDREGETEDSGDWEDRVVDIYVTADYPDRNPAPNPAPNPGPKPGPKPGPDPDPGPGTEQDAARNNTAQQQPGAPKESKQNLYVAVVACVVLLCLLLLAGIIVLLILHGPLIKEKHILQSSLDQLQNRLNNMTELKRMLCGGDGCYYYSTEGKTWEDSRAFCTARQSDLMTIKSREKQDFVVRLFLNKRMWIGLTDRETEGVWKWVDGTPLTTPYWWDNQPNNYLGGEDCSLFGRERWNDRPCSETQQWICEIVF